MTLHLITDRRRLAPALPDAAAIDCVIRQIEQAVTAGVNVVQIRERDLETRQLMTLTSLAMRAARGTPTRVVVNDRLDVALAARADGIHLPSHSLPVDQVRSVTPQGFIVGRSVHTATELSLASHADYVIAGTVWPSRSKPAGHACLGLSGLVAIAAAATVPVIAIGGITRARIAEIAGAGVAGIAGIGLFIGEPQDAPCGAVSLHDLVGAARAV